MLGNLVGDIVSRGFKNQNNRKAGNIFDYKPSSMSTFGFNTDVDNLTGDTFSSFPDYSGIFTPKEEKKRSGPFDFLKNQILPIKYIANYVCRSCNILLLEPHKLKHQNC